MERIEFTGIQETLLIPLWARAAESRKKRPIFYDPMAVEILNQIDYDFKKFNSAKLTRLGCCVRNLAFDDRAAWFMETYSNYS